MRSNVTKCSIAAAIAFVSLLWPSNAQEKAKSQSDAPAVTWDSLAERMKWEVERGFAGVVWVVRDGKIVFNEAYGMANREKNIPIKLDTIFAIGSTPIDFTKVGILLLAERGKLTLDDPITKHFDNVPKDKRAITIRHLMTGRSGLPNFHDVPSDRDPDHSWIDRDEAVRRIFDQELLFEPGKGQQHSHSAWGLLAVILEKANGQSYQDFTREHLFKPAGMTDTGFFGTQYPEERMAIGYGSRKDGEINAPPYWGKTSWLVMGSGGQVSTAPDMWRWVQAVHGGKIISAESLKLYAPPGQGMMTGGDMYGFEIIYAGNNRNCMMVISNVGSPRYNPQLRRLGQALTALVTGRTPPKFMLGIEFKVEESEPVKIARVVPGGAAERDGLKADDVIITVAGKPLGNEPMNLLAELLQTGNPIAFEIERDGKRQTISVKPKPRE